MARDLTTGFITNIEAKAIKLAFFFKAQFPSGDVLIWTGIGDYVLNGETYTGLGELIGVSPIKETQAVEAVGITVSLAGIPASLVSIALAEQYENTPVDVIVGTFDSSDVLSSYEAFTGKIDIMALADDGGESAIIKVQCENDLIVLTKVNGSLYTDEHQKSLFPSDRGLEFVATIEEVEIEWGQS